MDTLVDPNLTLAGDELTHLLRGRQRQLVDTLIAELASSNPAYARLPRELMEGDVRRVAARAVQMFIGAMGRGGRLTETELDELAGSAARRAEEGVNMETVLGAYAQSARVCVDTLARLVRPDEGQALVEVIRRLMVFLEVVTAAVGRGFTRAGRRSVAESESSLQVLASALLSGQGVLAAAEAAAVPLPEEFLVVSLVVDRHRDEDDPYVDRTVVLRRKLRRTREEFERQFPEVLWVPAGDGGLGLIPAPRGDEGRRRTPIAARLDRAIAEVVRVTSTRVLAAVVTAPPDEVPEAARLACEIAQVANTFDKPSGVYRLSDVVLEFQLSRPSAAHALLANLLAPLDDQHDLLETLTAFIDCRLNRQRCAARLHVHANTVDNRLRRIEQLTGLDPCGGRDLAALTAALTSRRLLKEKTT